MSNLNSICIFGGGSAGWLTALALRTYLPEVHITIAISKKHSNIGVGESTQPDLLDLLAHCNVDIQDFCKQVDTTQKKGIYYANWNTIGSNFWHPFTSLTETGTYTRAHHYNIMHKRDPKNYPIEDYYTRVHPNYDDYALHIDADKMATYLRNHLHNSVQIIDFDQYSIQSINNKIDYITVDGVEIKSDLYVDCTGFSKVLVDTIDNSETDNYEGNVNAALFTRIPYGHPRTTRIPHTKADAWGNGWCWTIPLTTRIGSGCTYNTNFCSTDDAIDHFVEYWEGAITKDDISAVEFSSKSLLNPWKSNVVAIGLSAGFVEPLEATGISWFVLSAQMLGITLRNRYFDDSTAMLYNGSMRGFIEDVQDFIDVHYMLSDRNDTQFWRYQTSVNRHRHPRLHKRLELYKKHMPNKNNRQGNVPWAFNDVSWLDILTGYHFDFDDQDIPSHLISEMNTELKEVELMEPSNVVL
jgi:hypothetical protein